MKIKNVLKKDNSSQECKHIVKLVGQLFTIEKKLRHNLKEQLIDKDTFMLRRQEQTQEVFQELHDYIYAIKDEYTPNSAMGKAFNYFVTYWDTLIQYPYCFESDPSDNLSERKIKDVVIGRRNWLFTVSQEGAEATALYYSLIVTAKDNYVL